ncbi:MFS transporter [Pseudomonas savastanoi]|uniref:Transport protein n=1 Tax=Pseudomonas savastanoi pv. glycinea TaxID=318 RepID=A0A3M3V6C6_PSESG|nr:MFS transporter [Pseudomonas savastanoi]RMM90670.1 hypothetical protein ALQ70_200008 [Pseudomonas savastanoi pv. glycinea]RMO39797.1 Transport protein [Pseudomonas savastanoi pv. glycinea]RMO40920.1 Transport protein [Pseudomonas savastanoi pv. glycinea]RMU07813.1 Transport protein [Pseudomonas savastanoi pv. glycinea]RMU23945.1 Transport protein [Pseudomonas savastanoi pv. glycinea]
MRWTNKPGSRGQQDLGFRDFLISDALMNMAFIIGQIALPWWLATQGEARDLVIYGVVAAITTLISFVVLSPLGDRYSKRQLLITGLMLCSVDALCLAVMATDDNYSLTFIVLFEVIGIIAFSIISPISISFVADLTPPAGLPKAMSLQKTSQSFGTLLGPLAAGLAIAVGGVSVCLWTYFLFLSLSVLFAFRLPSFPPPANLASKTPSITTWCRELTLGFKACWGIPLERNWTIVNVVTYIFRVPTVTLLVPLKIKSLDLSATWLGGCEAALSLGLIVGAIYVSAVAVRNFGRYYTRIWAAVIEGVLFALTGLCSIPEFLLLGYFLAGVANSVLVLVGNTHRVLARPAEFRSRMASVTLMANQIASAIGPLAAGLALSYLTVAHVYFLFGIFAAIGACGLLFVKGMSPFLALDTEQVVDWYKRYYPKAFVHMG